MSMQRAYSDLNLHDTRDLLKLLGDNKTVLTIFSNSNLPFSYAIKNRDFQEDDAWFCSEIGETSFVKGGSPHFKCKRSNVSPKDLWQHKRSVLLTSYA